MTFKSLLGSLTSSFDEAEWPGSELAPPHLCPRLLYSAMTSLCTSGGWPMPCLPTITINHNTSMPNMCWGSDENPHSENPHRKGVQYWEWDIPAPLILARCHVPPTFSMVSWILAGSPGKSNCATALAAWSYSIASPAERGDGRCLMSIFMALPPAVRVCITADDLCALQCRLADRLFVWRTIARTTNAPICTSRTYNAVASKLRGSEPQTASQEPHIIVNTLAPMRFSWTSQTRLSAFTQSPSCWPPSSASPRERRDISSCG